MHASFFAWSRKSRFLSVAFLTVISTWLAVSVACTSVYASTLPADPLVATSYSASTLSGGVRTGDFLVLYFTALGKNIPKSSTYISLAFTGLDKNSPEYDALQKAVYLDLIPNIRRNIKLDTPVKSYVLKSLLKKHLELDMTYTGQEPVPLRTVLSVLSEAQKLIDAGQTSATQDTFLLTRTEKFQVLENVFEKIRAYHVNSDKVSDSELVEGAIQGMAAATQDRYTMYFPAKDNEAFQSRLSGEFEGIGAEVEEVSPGQIRIVAPLSGSPAEAAGILAGDMIMAVDGVDVTVNDSLKTVTDRIKGKRGTTVVLHIARNGNTLDISIVRDVVRTEQVWYKKLDNGNHYIRITAFGDRTSSRFEQIMEAIHVDIGSGTGKLIIDVRNNPGGELTQVEAMLNYFVPKDKNVVVVRYRNREAPIASTGVGDDWTNRLSLVLLVNKGSASASEILVGTMRDYRTDAIVMGEKTYGKGSVQSFDQYNDGSAFKYTVAKWFTGKSQTSIDGIGIVPDMQVLQPDATTQDTIIKTDTQLEAAKNYIFTQKP